MAFVKLDCGMLDSTTWFDKDARDIFITALLMATPKEFDNPQTQLEVASLEPTGWIVPAGWYGFVDAASLGIINRCGLQTERGVEALERLGRPEPESRSQSHDGRRLVRIDGGFLVLNFINYREKDHTSADRQRRYRERLRTKSYTVTRRNITQAEAEAYTEAEAEISSLNGKAWSDYLEHRADLKKPLTTRGANMQIAKLAVLPHDVQQAVVDLSIANGWTGLFPEKRSKSEAHKRNDSFDAVHARVKARAGLD